MTHITEFQLNEYLDDALDEKTRPAVEAHLETCARCRQSLAQLQLVFTALASVADAPLTADLSQQVMAVIQTENRPSSRMRLLLLAQLAAAVAMLARLWPSIQPSLSNAGQAARAALAALELQQLFAWERLAERVTAVIRQAQTTGPALELVAWQWSLLLGLALLAWLAGNRLLFAADMKRIT